MSAITEVKIPDIGGAEHVDVIEVLVKSGDHVAVDDSLITLEGDKATMEIPAPVAGVVKAVKINVGDKVSEGDVILTIEEVAAQPKKSQTKKSEKQESTTRAEKPATQQKTNISNVTVPDIGGAENVDIIEVFVKKGDNISVDDSLITLEGDKATMEVPSPIAGVVAELKVKVGDKVSAGSVILTAKTTEATSAAQESVPTAAAQQASSAPAQSTTNTKTTSAADVYAGPAVRRIAHEFNIDLARVPATGAKGRITKDDIIKFIKGQSQGGGTGLDLPAWPQVDFSKFGPVETRVLSKIQKISGPFLHRNWVSIPHITQTIDADITAMEAFRQEQKEFAKQQGIRLTPLVFIMKAAVAALKEFPTFNASLAANGQEVILKKYFHLGVAVDTPNGLVVPVIRDVDKKGMFELAQELADISKKARDKGLNMTEMSGGCFSISSLGGIGGGYFTPIINAPEVAILGVSRSAMQPVYQPESGDFIPRLMLPLSLSYDHRVIDGAEGARFITYLAERLADIRTLLL